LTEIFASVTSGVASSLGVFSGVGLVDSSFVSSAVAEGLDCIVEVARGVGSGGE